MAIAVPAGAAASGHTGRAGARAVVVVQTGPFGPVLAVGGAGPLAGQSLYMATIDPPTDHLRPGKYQPGCTSTYFSKTTFLGSPVVCTARYVAANVDWPALTTQNPPVAGPGVNPSWLGEVWVRDLGAFQVTYAGHPLYVFDAPAALGANILESAQSPQFLIPPWRTQWRLLAPSGRPATGPAGLAVERPIPGLTSYTSPALGAAVGQFVHEGVATVYWFSLDGASSSACNGACARTFIPLLTVGTPTVGTGVTGSVGVIARRDGSWQVTYNGHPLYLYSGEQFRQNIGLGLTSTSSAGNGKGVHAFDGVFRVVAP
jgi:predicted lipoprotein with Yx(FWY)xxD motif